MMPDPAWEMVYAADRRKHRHRCRVCGRIVRPGERVLMARVCGGKTKVSHVEPCAATEFDGFTERELLTAHGMQYLARCGWPEAQRFVETAPIFRVRGAA